MTNAAIYLRISQDRSGEQAGIQRQRKDCEKLANERGWKVANAYIDNDVSAYSRKPRPEFERMMSDIGSGQIQAVIAWAADRLYRRTTDLDRIVDSLSGVQVATVKSGDVDLETADGRLNARLLASVAQNASEKAGERIKSAAEQRSRQGKYCGGIRRFGYTKTADALVEGEAEVLRSAYAQVLDGVPLMAIAREWQSRGIVGPRGASISAVILRDYLLRPINAGIATYKGKEVGAAQTPQIIDEETFRTVRAILTDPKRLKKGRPGKNLLTGIMRCSVCGKPVTASSRIVKDRQPTLSYACRERHVSRVRQPLDELVSELVIARLQKDPEGFTRPPSKGKGDSSAAVDAEKTRKRLDDLADLFAAGELEAADYAAATRLARVRLGEIEATLTQRAGTSSAATLLGAEDVRKAWQGADIQQRRAVIGEVIDVIIMGPGKKGTFAADNLDIRWRTP